jgi:hypothetical protein
VPARPAGWYLVTFDLDTTGCTFGAVAGAGDSSYSIIARTTVNAESAALSRTGAANQVLVLVRDTDGGCTDSRSTYSSTPQPSRRSSAVIATSVAHAVDEAVSR